VRREGGGACRKGGCGMRAGVLREKWERNRSAAEGVNSCRDFGRGGYGRRVNRPRGDKITDFWQKHSPTCDFYMSAPPPT
jgi:hypothetical protein